MAVTDEEGSRIALARQGDPGAFAALVRTHQHMIHSLTYRMTGSMAESEDLAQETFLRAYRQLGTFRGTAKFSTWLYRIALNLCLNWREREKTRGRLQDEWARQADPDPAPETGELARRVGEALLQLPAKQRAAIVLTVYEGRSHAEAATLLGCSETTVSWRIFAARRRLARLLRPGETR